MNRSNEQLVSSFQHGFTPFIHCSIHPFISLINIVLLCATWEMHKQTFLSLFRCGTERNKVPLLRKPQSWCSCLREAPQRVCLQLLPALTCLAFLSQEKVLNKGHPLLSPPWKGSSPVQRQSLQKSLEATMSKCVESTHKGPQESSNRPAYCVILSTKAL